MRRHPLLMKKYTVINQIGPAPSFYKNWCPLKLPGDHQIIGASVIEKVHHAEINNLTAFPAW